MKISNKLKAAGICAGILVGSVFVSVVLQFVAENVDRETIGMVAGGMFVSALFYLMYQVILARLDYEDTLKNLNKSITKNMVDQ